MEAEALTFSGIKGRRDYRRDYYSFEVKVDGVTQIDCVGVNVAKGIAVVLVRERDGHIAMNKFQSGPKIEVRRGRVTVHRTSEPVDGRYSAAFLQLFGKHIGVAQ